MRTATIVAVAALSLAACGSSKSAAPTGTTPEQVTTSAAAVAAGLTQIKAIASDVAASAGSDKAAAKDADSKIEPIWATIEGTVKSNDADTYLAFEDAFSALETAAESGDGAKGTDGSSRVTSTVDAYLASYPG